MSHVTDTESSSAGPLITDDLVIHVKDAVDDDVVPVPRLLSAR